MGYNLHEIAKHFAFDGEFLEAMRFGSGHINDTFTVYFKKNNGQIHRYILQKINGNVFKTPEKMMENIEGVTAHLRKKIILSGGDPERETLTVIATKEGGSFYKTEAGDYWRAYVFIENAHSYDVVENPNHFYSAGKALGRFQELLADFPVGKLNETIKDFHNTAKRYSDFIEAVNQNIRNRAGDIKAEIDFIMGRSDETSRLINFIREGKLPLRVTHNDTKFNNVMIDDRTGEGLCIVDLDTVMPGLSLYDFGDAIRSGANPAYEDERDLSKVMLDLKLFEYFSRGYIESANVSLTETELEYLPFAAKMMTFECGMRFLTDYLNGDTYFKVRSENQNLDRARTQFKLVKDMEEKMDLMMKIIENLGNACKSVKRLGC